MTITPVPEVIVTPIAYFPEKYFPENLIVRTDGSVLITAVLQKELWYVPGPARTLTDLRHLLGDPFDPVIVGPSSAYWGTQPGEEGKVIYVTTDGGTTAPPDGVIRNAALLRAELNPRTNS